MPDSEGRDLIDSFAAESEEDLAQLDAALLALEVAADPAPTLAQVFRLMHTLKGTAGFLALTRVQRLAHATEEVLAQARDGAIIPGADLVGAVLASVDRLRTIVAALARDGEEPAGDDADLSDRLAALAAGDRLVSGSVGAPAPSPRPPAAAPVGSIRVGVSVLESLMRLAGELVLTRNQLLHRAAAMPEVAGDAALGGSLHRLQLLTADLQDTVMRARMQPLGAAWGTLRRLVRDLAHDLGKTIVLDLDGGDTELDRQVLEAIRDPLAHMVRNCADHGLESPAERRALGKPEAGRITLRASHRHGMVQVDVSDDGRGLDLDRIRARASAAGLASAAEIAAMDDHAACALIFRPGLSTAPQVTAVSGRGVGLDVVRTNIEALGGTVKVSSTPGAGAQFTLLVPLTLAVVPALVVAAGGQRFAMPLLAVAELTRLVDLEPPESVGGCLLVRWRERLLPLLSLAALLRLPNALPVPVRGDVMAIQSTAGMVALAVDAVFASEDIVVSPLAIMLRHLTVFSGCTLLGDGGVALVLDPLGIARAGAAGEVTHLHPPPAPCHPPDPADSLLLFRAGLATMAAPLRNLLRLETIQVQNIDWGTEIPPMAVVPYRDGLLPLFALTNRSPPHPEPAVALVIGPEPTAADLRGAPCAVGLLVDALSDVVRDRLHLVLPPRRPGFLGTAIVAGEAAEVLDASYWLARAGTAGPPEAQS